MNFETSLLAVAIISAITGSIVSVLGAWLIHKKSIGHSKDMLNRQHNHENRQTKLQTLKTILATRDALTDSGTEENIKDFFREVNSIHATFPNNQEVIEAAKELNKSSSGAWGLDNFVKAMCKDLDITPPTYGQLSAPMVMKR